MSNQPPPGQNDVDYVLQRYETAIQYYWQASRHNKRAYKTTRYLTVMLGAILTLIASLSSAEFVAGSASASLTFAIATPVLAAVLTIVGGFAQAFHWGPAWREMVLTAQRLETERDRVRIAHDENEAERDVALLNELVHRESETFFGRILGKSGPG